MSEDRPPSSGKEPGQRSSKDVRRKQLMTAGVAAAGIGSAAIVAALLYAKGARRNQD